MLAEILLSEAEMEGFFLSFFFGRKRTEVAGRLVFSDFWGILIAV